MAGPPFIDKVARAGYYATGAYHDGYYGRARQPYPDDYNNPQQRDALDTYYQRGLDDRAAGRANAMPGQGLGDPDAGPPPGGPPQEGDLLRSSDGDPRVWHIANRQRHWVVSPQEFDARGYRWDAVRFVSPDVLNAVPRGADEGVAPPDQAGPPPGPPPIGGLSPAEAQRWYDQGYDTPFGVPPRGDLGDVRTAPVGTPAYYYWLGYQDGQARRPRQSLYLPDNSGGAPILNPAIGYELYPSIFGKGQPLNAALTWTRLFSPIVKWELLGGYAGDRLRGFKLSGPNGLVMQVGRASGMPPESFGLNAYVGVHDAVSGRSQVRLLDAAWLNDNIGPDWWA